MSETTYEVTEMRADAVTKGMRVLEGDTWRTVKSVEVGWRWAFGDGFVLYFVLDNCTTSRVYLADHMVKTRPAEPWSWKCAVAELTEPEPGSSVYSLRSRSGERPHAFYRDELVSLRDALNEHLGS